MLAGDALRQLLQPSDLDELTPLATKRYPSILPGQALNRYLADAESCVDRLEQFANGQPPESDRRR